MNGWGTIFTNGMIPLDCGIAFEGDREMMDLFAGQWSTTLELIRIPSATIAHQKADEALVVSGHCNAHVSMSTNKPRN